MIYICIVYTYMYSIYLYMYSIYLFIIIYKHVYIYINDYIQLYMDVNHHTVAGFGSNISPQKKWDDPHIRSMKSWTQYLTI